MTTIHEADLYGMGKPEVILENSLMKVIISPHLGARIVEVRADGRQFLYTMYPKGNPSGFYNEYGGIEEFLDRPPGRLWRQAWKHEIEADSVKLCSRENNIFLEKRISLDETMPVVKIDYCLLNMGPNLIKPAFGIHPEICLDNDAASNHFHIPTERGIFSGGCEQIKRRYVRPSQGWCAATGGRSLLGMFFPDKLLDGVEAYYPATATHLNLSPLIYHVGLSPGKEARFTCAVYFGEGGVDSAVELWEKYSDRLTGQYISAAEDRLAMAVAFKPPEGVEITTGTEESEERKRLLERMDKLAERKNERMEILNLLRERQISVAEAIEKFRLMKEDSE